MNGTELTKSSKRSNLVAGFATDDDLRYNVGTVETARHYQELPMQPIFATYQNGVFAPEQPVEIPEGARVNLWIVPDSEDAVYLSDEDRAFLRELADKRKHVFERLAE